ncbi:MAG TPA: VTT domain-containing protein [Candidatus Acidoferrales bacterium]|nr:VTT domain-containing protein [Candidatus Acidoferrales bacterium]
MAIPTQALHFLLRHGYPVLFGWVLLEQGGLPLPSAPLLLLAGALAGSGHLRFDAALAVVLGASLIADSGWFYWGKKRGGGVLRLVCWISLEPDTCVRRTKDTLTRRGRWAILVAKFIPGLNAAVPPLAGMTGMSYAEFVPLDSLGVLLWAGAYTGLGRLFSGQLNRIGAYASGFGGLILVGLAAALAVHVVRKYAVRRRLIKEIWTERIEPDELRELLEEGEPVSIIDLRHSLDFHSHPFVIPGALHLAPEELDRWAAEIPRDREIVFYCT